MPNVKDIVVITCEWCAAPFETTYYRLSKGGRRFCSHRCGTRNQMAMQGSRPVGERFWRHVSKGSGDDDCWLWDTPGPGGYGYIHTGTTDAKRMGRAHVIALELARGRPTPDTRRIHTLHTCDTPRCVRNAPFRCYRVGDLYVPCWGHLFLGTAKLNDADKRQKGRARDPRGEGIWTAILTEPQVIAIRARAASGERQIELAQEHGISPHQVWMIVHRRAWQHVV